MYVQTYLEPLSGRHDGETAIQVPDRNPVRDARALPDRMYGFAYFDRIIAELELNGQVFRLEGEEFNTSGTMYIDAELLTIGEALASLNWQDTTGRSTLRSMERHGATHVVRIRNNWWAVYNAERDTFVSTK